MSGQESDGINEVIEELLRVAVLLGTRLAERRVREREQRLRDAARHSLEAARGERDRQVHDRDRALAAIEGVYSSHWWEHAGAEDIRHAWGVAREYQAQEPRAARAVWRIADQLRDRYGLDVRELDPAALGQQPQLAQHATLTDQELGAYDRRLRRNSAELASTHASADPERQAELAQQMRQIDGLRTLIARELAEHEQQPGPAEQRRRDRRELQDAQLRADPLAPAGVSDDYDSHERRYRLAERLAALDVPAATVEAVVLADTGQAQPAEAAASASSQRATPGAADPRRNLQRHRRRGR